MKKNVILFSTTLVILSLLIFGFTKTNVSETNDKALALDTKTIESPILKNIPDLYYGVDTRHEAVTKEDVHNATTIYNFFNVEENQQLDHINSVEIVMIKDNQQSRVREYGIDAQLNVAQIDLLKATDYFSHFTIRTEFKAKNEKTGKLEERFFGPHFTVVPDKQAIYNNGNESLINYLKDNSKDYMNVIEDNNLGAIKISFIVSKEGVVKDVNHDAMTTGYPSIDKKLIDLIKNIPGQWTPAENAKGEKMEQELMFTFGPRDGC